MKNVEDLYPLSPMQQGLLFHSLLAPESGFYVLQLSCTVKGLNVAAFNEAWQQIMPRHPILRTAFLWEGIDEPLQLVRQKVQLNIEQQDWRTEDENTQQERFEQLLEADRRRGFDLSNAPLMRLYLIRVEDDVYRFLWSSHHILLDGWSASLLLKEVFTLYEAFVVGKQVRLEEVPPYSNYIAWLQEQDKSEAEGFWRQTLAGFTVPTPLGIGRPAASLSEDEDTYGTHQFSLSADLTSALQTVARQQRLTLNTLVQGAWALLLSRYSREKDVVFGMTVSGRPAALPGVEQMIGLFINTLPVRVQVPDDASLLSWLQQLQEQQQKQAQFDYTPLIDIQGWSDVERGQPLFESILGFENYPVDEALRNQPFGLEIADLRFSEKTNFPINLAVMPGKELLLDLMYNGRRFDEATILRLCGHLETLLRSFVDNPKQRLSALPIVTEAEQQQMLRDWNQTAAVYPQEVCLHQLFEAQAARTPEHTALSFQGRHLTYAELNSRANRFAHYLRSLGVGPEVLVGLMVGRSVEMVVALLGILKAGGAYLPLDPSYPIERLSFMLDDAQVPVLITGESVPDGLVSERVKVVVLEKEQERIEQEPDENLTGIDVVPQNLAYVIYTSGSTGQPKGVLITHRAVVNHNFGMAALYELQPHDRVLQFASLSFDVAVEEMYPTWLRGGCVVLRPEGVLSSHTDFLEFLKEERVSVVNLTTPYWNELMAEAARTGVRVNGSLRLAAVGGEKGLPEGFAFARKQVGDGVRLMNVYGPTETTVTNTVYEVNGVAAHEEAVSVPIGRPIANTQLYILDDRQQPLPVGVGGELHIGTDSIARGYLNRPEQTAEKFIPHPFSDEPGARLYKTGDVARFLSDGNVEFLGRVDHQVKVRGFRIELGEIEAVLTTHDSVREVVVIAREDTPGDKRVVAYVVPEHELRATELRNFVLERLPDHMCPSAFVMLEAFPLTSNGKVNRRALPAPDHAPNQQSENFVAPRTPVEDLLAGIWADVLAIRQVGIHDDFFELGGHSLLATQLMSRMREAFSLEIPLRQLFESPTIAELAQYIEAARKTETQLQAPAIVPVSREGVLPLSFAQQRLWFMDQLEPGSNRFNVSAAIRLSGQLNLEALERTLAEIVRRHESLRTSFVAVDGEPVHVISPAGEVNLSFTDLSTESSKETRALELAADEAQRPFDLSCGPLLRTQLLRLEESEHVLLLTMHHIVTDGWSLGVLVKEVAALYSAYIQDQPSPLPELNIQYADFAHWQRNWLQGEVLEEQLAYWRERLSGAPALLELPTDRPRPAVQSFRGAQHSFRVGAELTEQLQQLSRQEGVTLFMTLLAAFQTLLWRYSGESDVVVGADVANRNRQETEALIGFFVNMLVLRTRMAGEESFEELLQQVREVCLGGYAHQDVPFEKLVEELQPERSLSHTPLFQVVFVLQNQPMGELTLPGLRLSEMEVEDKKAIFDLILDMTETPQGIEAFFSYNTDLFDPETIERMSQHLVALLEAVVVQPQSALNRLNLLSAGERELLEQWNDTVRAYPEQMSPAQLFEEQVARAPEQIAVVFEDEEISYGELNRRANQLAHRLRSLGVGPEVLVGVLLERSVEMVVGLLGILKAGGGYLPLDASYPLERLSFMLEDAQAPVLLTQERLLDSVPAAYWGAVLTLDQESLAEEPEENPEVEWLGGEQLCYVAYTSGSTGQPKGVAVPQRAVARLVKSTNYAEFSAAERILQLAPLSFDAATLELWGSLLNGGRLVVMSAGQPTLAELAQVIERQGITLMWLTAGLFHQMVDEQLETLREVRQVLAGGDVLSPGHVERLLEAHEGEAERWVINGYGPTENTTFSACYRMRAGDELSGRSVSIGVPITNTQVYVLDERMAPAPVGVAGELYVAGAGLARGYLQQAELTAERFVPHPYSSEPGARLYRTGDVVRYRRGGELEFVGRRDEQVKVRGFRIELGEIETALLSHAAVKEAVVIARAEERGEKRLVAYVVQEPAAPALPAVGEWRKYLSEKLPDHMIPSLYVELAELPLNANGKVERKQLPAPEIVRTDEPRGLVLAQTQIEKLIAGMWEQVLGIEQIGITEDFFELGGHSLLATQLMSRLRDTFGIEVPLRQLFEAPTIAEVAQHIETVLTTDAQLQAPPVVPVSRENALPLSFAQQRLWFIDQLEPESALYNVPAVLSLKGVLDIDVLEQTFDEVVRRHESLRTTFNNVDGQPLQIIHPSSPQYFSLKDLTDVPETVSNLIAEETQRPFNLSTGPVLRVTLFKLEELDYVLVVNLHHIVSDAWSLGVLIQEVVTLYSAFLHAQPSPLPELSVQYADFAHWQRNWFQDDVLERQLSYWRTQLSGAPALLELPTDRPRPAVQSFRGANHKFTLDAELSEKLQELSRREGVTLFMTLLAAFQTLLWRYSGEPDVVVGTPIAGRNRSETEQLIGFFINTLVLRTKIEGKEDFTQLLKRVREVALGAFAHQDMPFEKLVEELEPERNLSHSPLFQVVFTLQNAPLGELELPGLQLSHVTDEAVLAKFDLILSLDESAAGLKGEWDYNTDLFDASTIERMTGHLQSLLAGIVTNPQQALCDLPLLTAGEQQLLVQDWNQTDAAYPQDLCLHELFAAQAARTPESIAVSFQDRRLTYRELDQRANQLAHRLRSLGVGPEVLVGVLMERSLELVVGLMGILKAGGAYLPLDPSYPEGRLSFMLADAQAPILLTQPGLVELLPEYPGQMLCLNEEGYLSQGEAERSETPASGVSAANLSYVIYTSGSTGRPKGAMNTHAGICNRLHWMQSAYQLSSEDRVLQKTSFSFDVSVWEFFWPLLTGARLVMAEPGGHRDSAYLVRVIREQGITTMHFVPSMLQAFLAEAEVESCSSLKRVVCSGEALPFDLQERFFKKLPEVELHNLYGPTEAAVDVTSWACEKGSKSGVVPIGKPIANTEIYILDQQLNPTPVGVAGELYIGGVQLARGYFNRSELTAERFIPHPFSREGGELLYRTGDLASFQTDGNIRYLGRLDHQVKIRGFRIELGEIESTLTEHPAVHEAVVVTRQYSADDERLVAYVVPDRSQATAVLRMLRMEQEGLPADAKTYELPNGMVVFHQNKSETDFVYDEIFEQEVYLKHGVTLNEGDCVFDVGANIGMFTLFVGRRCKDATIYAFEPIPPVFESLCRNAELYDLNVKLLQYGVSDQAQEAVFTFHPHVSVISGRYSDATEDRQIVKSFLRNQQDIDGPNAPSEKLVDELVADRLEVEHYTCQLRSISDVIREFNVERIDLLKIDAEKSELDVLSGIADEDWTKIKQLVVEVHDIDGRLEWVTNLLRGNGYTMEIEQDRLLRGTGLYNVYAVRPSNRQQNLATTNEKIWASAGTLLNEVQALLREKLPSYMVPSAIVLLESIPLTPNGKLDRGALPAPVMRPEKEHLYIAPRTAQEEILASIWQQLLGVAQVGVNDNFFSLGGHSLLATQLMSRLREAFGVEISLRQLFEGPTIAKLAQFIEEARQTDSRPPMLPVSRDQRLPLSFSQQRLWFVDQLNPGSAAYNVPLAVRFNGSLSPEILGQTLTEIVRRHEILRTRFVTEKGQAYQQILPAEPIAIPLVDLSELDQDEQRNRTDRLIAEVEAQSFDLSSGKLFRALLIKLGTEEFILSMSMHHIISDAWSLSVLMREFQILYAAFKEGRESQLPELELQYADFAVWQREWLQGEVLDHHQSYWRQKLSGLKPLELPTDYPRLATRAPYGQSIAFSLHEDLSTQLKDLTQREGVTLFMTLIAAFQLVLGKTAGQQDVAIGTSIANRNHLETENLIGFFVNELVLRADLEEALDFRSLLRQVRQTVLEAYAYQDMPFDALVEELAPDRVNGRSPLFDVLFVLQNTPMPSTVLHDLELNAIPATATSAKFDLTMFMYEGEKHIGGELHFDATLFEAATIERFIAHFERVLSEACANPDAPLFLISLTSPLEAEALIADFSDSWAHAES